MNLKFFTRTAILLALTLAFQMLKLPQPMTGPAVNAMLFISTAAVGIWGGVIIGALTPWIAFINGILNPAGTSYPYNAWQCSALYCIRSGEENKYLFSSSWCGGFQIYNFSTAMIFGKCAAACS